MLPLGRGYREIECQRAAPNVRELLCQFDVACFVHKPRRVCELTVSIDHGASRRINLAVL